MAALTCAPCALADDFIYVPGEILVSAKPGRDAEVLDALAGVGLKVLQTDPFSGVMRVRVAAGREMEMIADLSARDEFLYAERNGIGFGGADPNDTFFNIQWHLKNIGQSGGTPGADIDAISAWTITTGSSSIGIAVLDAGIQSNHPDFAGRIAPNGWNFVDGNNNPEDVHGHGTWVSGAVAANTNNSFAVAGVDWHCTIIPIKVINGSGTTFNLAQGLNYCANQNNIHIINLSLINYPCSATLNTALQTARNAGKILIACAGNNGIGNADVSCPGASPLTISVGWTTRTDSRAPNSATGNALDFVAPGAAIVTTAHGTLSNTSVLVSGCSFATPITAGVAGLLLARAHGLGMTLTHDDIYDLLLAGAEDQVGPAGEDTPGWDPFFGHGRINAYLSLLAMQPLLNSCCQGAIDVDEGVTPFNTSQASTCGHDEPEHCTFFGDSNVRNDLWFRHTAECTGLLTVDLCASSFPAKLAIYGANCPQGPGEVIACNVAACGTRAKLTIPANAGETFLLRIGGHLGAQGDAVMDISCKPGAACPGDLNDSGAVDVQDLLILLGAWGPNPGHPADLNGSGAVDVQDLLILLGAWGPCP